VSTITFDTHDFVIKMRETGFDEKQAEAVVRVVSASQSELITNTRCSSFYLLTGTDVAL
jgi:hypothetical protein